MDLMLTLLTGGASGLLGTAVTAVTGFLERHQRHRMELDLRRLEIEETKVEAASAERIAATEAESAESSAAWTALSESYAAAGRRWSSGDSRALVFVDVVRGLTRPALTLLFLALTGWIYWTLVGDAAGAGLRTQIVHTVLYLTTTCVVWWFGGRPRQAPK